MPNIAITGPESTGKSTLVRELAAMYECRAVSEYAREYLQSKPSYDQNDLLRIAREQFQRIPTSTEQLVLIDTEILVIKIWSMVKYQQVDPEIEQLFNTQPVDFYLLTYPDLPWEADPLRESKDTLHELFVRYETALETSGKHYAIVSGTGGIRLTTAKNLIDGYLNQ